MKTLCCISAMLVGLSFFAHANIQTKANPDKPSEVFLATANGSASYTYPPSPWLGDLPVRISWNWDNTKGGSYSYVSLVENGIPDSLWSGYEEYDTWDTNGLASSEVWVDRYYCGIPPNRYLLDTKPIFFRGFPWEIGSLAENTTVQTLNRNSKVTIQLKTGGKKGSKLQNLFGLPASATGYRHLVLGDDDNTPEPSDSYPIAPTSIQVAGQAVGTNGVAYAIFPDNATVDITPKTTEKYYAVNVSAQKYKSYFEVFVNQPYPGPIYYTLETAGHAFWQLKTEAPYDALQYISPSLTVYLNHNWGFYPHGADCGLPGLLANDDTHGYSVKRVFYIGFPDLLAGLQFTRGISNAPPEYCIAINGYSCVGAAREAGSTVGVWLPSDWTPQNFGVGILLRYQPASVFSDDTPRYAQ